ncbi:MAG TPA: poly-gamma-glutamate system protein, partial [bacterium]|jgi:poly-gamma-glutamate system protein
MVLAAGLFYWSENSRVRIRQPNYDLKMQAAQRMLQAIDALRGNRAASGWALDEVNDPNQSALIGERFSLITTDQGELGAKLTSINPNFAAVILQMLLDAGVEKGDKVAVGFTGSFPALNIAVIIACEVLEVEPVIITSVGSSSWGANEPEFTYLDMERILFERGLIRHRTLAASIGGGEDIGRALSRSGRNLIEDAIRRNQVIAIEGKSLEENMDVRRQIYREQAQGKSYAVFINVGGGLAALGSAETAALIPPGLNIQYYQMNYPARGILFDFWEQAIPVIHLLNVDEIALKYGLPRSPVPLPSVGLGKVFTVERYNLTIATISAIILFSVLSGIVLLDRDKYKLREEGVDPDILV